MNYLLWLSKTLVILTCMLVLLTLNIMDRYSAQAQSDLPICSVSGEIAEDTVWGADCLYRIDNHVTISANATLTIQPGTIIKFASNKLLGVKGILRAQATADKPIYFTSLLDDGVGGDTNGDGRTTLPAMGSWGHIAFLNDSIDSENLIEHAIIRYGGNFFNDNDHYYRGCWDCTYRGAVIFFSASPSIRSVVFEQNSGYGLSASLDSLPLITDITFSQNAGNGLEIRGGTLNSNAATTFYWKNTDVVYAITGHVTIGNNDTLVIDPGIIVKFADNILMGVNGALQIKGDSENSVYITSLHDDTIGGDTNNNGRATLPVKGKWGHIAFFDPSVDGENLIDNANIRYGGRFFNDNNHYYRDCWDCTYHSPVIFFRASPTVRNTHFEQNNGFALSADVYSYPQLTKNTFADNNGNGFEIRGGAWASSEVTINRWSNTGIVYVVNGNLTIGNNDTLMIDPGVIVKFADNRLLGVRGALQVNGTNENPAYLTSVHDDMIGGDTNNNSRASEPAAGNWGHIVFFDESLDNDSLIENAIIRYGGQFFNDNNHYYPDCWDCTYRGAILFNAASPVLRQNSVVNNQHGLVASGNSAPKLICNNIYDNLGFGFQNNNTIIPIPVQNQWWGNPSGPTHASNPGGIGQSVSDGVDFIPWASQPCVDSSGPPPTPTFTSTPLPTATPTTEATATSTPENTPEPPTSTPIPQPTNTPIPTPAATSAVPPVITEIRPNQGRSDAGNELNIYGQKFVNGAVVRLNDIALDTTFVDATLLRADTAAGLTAGVYDVTVANPDGGRSTLKAAYTVFDSAINDDLFTHAYELWTEPLAPRANSQTKLQIMVHRQGGKSALLNVKVRFYVGDPQAGGKLIGESVLPPLSPREFATSPSVTWTPADAGEYIIYAMIDPEDLIDETYEDNNLVSRTITVLPTAVDQIAPHVDSFTINDGAGSTTDAKVRLSTVASDPEPGRGVTKLLFIEYEFSTGAEQWTPVRSSTWLDYATSKSNYEWNLIPTSGLKYLQAWAADAAGNVSLFPYKAYINFLPSKQRVGANQRQIYRYPLKAGETLYARVEPVSGDPDLYVWAPDHDTRPPWISNLQNAIDDVSVVAPIDGIYQIEIYGFATAEYRLVVEVTSTDGVASAQSSGGIDPTKTVPAQPPLPNSIEPNSQIAIMTPGGSQPTFYLPLISR